VTKLRLKGGLVKNRRQPDQTTIGWDHLVYGEPADADEKYCLSITEAITDDDANRAR
jgi:hypothetical protein